MSRNTDINRRILIADDNKAIHEDYRKILCTAAPSDAALDRFERDLFGDHAPASTTPSYEIDSAFQGPEAVAMVERACREGRPYAVAFVDMRMPPGVDGVETIERMWKVDQSLLVVICTAYSDQSVDEITARLGLTHRLLILKKPFDRAEIVLLACALTAKWTRTRQASLRMAELEAAVTEKTHDLCRSQERYRLAASGANDGLWDWDIVSGDVFYSERWAAIVGIPEMEPSIDAWLSRIHADDVGDFRSELDAHLAGTTQHLEHEHRLVYGKNHYRWVLCRAVAVRNESGTPIRMAGSLTDITGRKEHEEELRRGAFFDRLTGLPNRALLRDSIDHIINDASVNSNYAVLFLDFDRFKVINDSLGHLAGDKLLVSIAERLTSCIHRMMSGIVRTGSYTIGRLGGDEFVIVINHIRDESKAVNAAARILEALADPFVVDHTEVVSSASIGIALGDPEYTTADEVLRDADTAMYEAKARGRACSAVFTRAMREQVVARLQLELDLRVAVEREELMLHYQPIVGLGSASPVGAEALLRWKHPERGLISPDKFIPIAEETGLIVSIGKWVLNEACRQLVIWRRTLQGGQDLSISVNISSRQLIHGDLVAHVDSALKRHQLPAAALHLEVTESAIMEDVDAAIAALKRLRAIGVRISMDDFGTGYSSLSYLKKLPLDELKIDRSFVFQLGDASPNQAIIHAIVCLARNLHMQVVAEGVENADQLATILALDCDLGQGYHFSRPLAADDFASWFSAWTPRLAAA